MQEKKKEINGEKVNTRNKNNEYVHFIYSGPPTTATPNTKKKKKQ